MLNLWKHWRCQFWIRLYSYDCRILSVHFRGSFENAVYKFTFDIFTSAKEVMFLPVFVCLFVCLCVSKITQKVMHRSFWNFWEYVGHGINYQWLNFGGDLTGILDSGSLWNFRYHCVEGRIREPLAKRRWWRHLANSFALAEVPALSECFL